jgi:uncharacterized protein (TIGR02217 family)
MSLHLQRFPAELSKKAVGGPTFSTTIATQASGKERRNINWKNSQARYSIALKNLSAEEAKTIIAFFHSCCGRAYSFRFKDWLDFEASREQIAIGDGTRKDFYLCKTYQAVGRSFTRFITKPVPERVKVFVDDIVQASAVVDYESGKVTFPEAPLEGAVITASFEFDVEVRFNNDELKIAIDGTLSNSVKELEFIEVK